jgi:hypothetical protein
MRAPIVAVILVLFVVSHSFSQTTWTSVAGGAWNNPANWSTGVVPDANTIVVFNAAANGNCALPAGGVTISALQITGYTGSIDVAGTTLTINNTANGTAAYNNTFSSGTIRDLTGGGSLAITTTVNVLVTFSGTNINVPVTGNVSRILFNGSTFQGAVNFTKTGATIDTGTGNNTFNSTFTFNNNSTATFSMGATTRDIFQSTVTLTNSGAGLIKMANNQPGNQFNGDVILNCTAGTGIYFCHDSPGTATATLAAGRTITIGGAGFATGRLRLGGFTSSGAQSITLTGDATLRVSGGTHFQGTATLTAPLVQLNGAIFDGAATITNTGSTDVQSFGGNTFHSTATFLLSGACTWTMNATDDDLFEDELTLTITAAGTISMASTQDCQFSSNIIMNTTSAGAAIQFGNNGGISTLADGGALQIGPLGYVGLLHLRKLTQIGNTPQTLTISSPGTLRIGNFVDATHICTFNGPVSFTAPNIRPEGGVYNNSVYMEKTQAVGTVNETLFCGNNTFNANATIVNNSLSDWYLGVNASDTFIGHATFSRLSTGALAPAASGINQFQGDITLNGASSVVFGINGGTLRLTGTNEQVITSNGTQHRINNLELNKALNNVSQGGDILIANSAVLTAGRLTINPGSYIEFDDNATVAGASDASHIDGLVRKTGNDAFVFPVGANGFYRPVSISAPALATNAFSAQYINEAQTYGTAKAGSLDHLDGCEYWLLNRVAGTSNVTVTLSWNAAACPELLEVTVPADMRVAQWDGLQWSDFGNGGTTGTSTNGTVATAAAATGYGAYTLASSSTSNPLPIELVYFRAQAENNHVQLTWETASEVNCDQFIIECSHESLANFIPIGSIKASGGPNITQHYVYLDEVPLTGTTYYRLVQLDMDGTREVFRPVSVLQAYENEPLMAYPNPVTRGGNSFVKLTRATDVRVYNNYQQLVFSSGLTDTLDIREFHPGVYILITSEGEVIRLIIL